MCQRHVVYGVAKCTPSMRTRSALSVCFARVTSINPTSIMLLQQSALLSLLHNTFLYKQHCVVLRLQSTRSQETSVRVDLLCTRAPLSLLTPYFCTSRSCSGSGRPGSCRVCRVGLGPLAIVEITAALPSFISQRHTSQRHTSQRLTSRTGFQSACLAFH